MSALTNPESRSRRMCVCGGSGGGGGSCYVEGAYVGQRAGRLALPSTKLLLSYSSAFFLLLVHFPRSPLEFILQLTPNTTYLACWMFTQDFLKQCLSHSPHRRGKHTLTPLGRPTELKSNLIQNANYLKVYLDTIYNTACRICHLNWYGDIIWPSTLFNYLNIFSEGNVGIALAINLWF